MLVPAVEGYRVWAATYDVTPNPLVALESRVLGGLLGELCGKKILDVACGTGRWAAYAQACGATVLGIDRCHEMLTRCSAPAVLADARRLPISDAWADITICALALGYLAEPMSELIRVTRRGGSVFVSDVHPQALDRNWKHSFRNGSEVYEIEHRRYELPELLLTPGLHLVRLLEPAFGAPELEVFRRGGKESSFSQMCEVPAVYVAEWIKL